MLTLDGFNFDDYIVSNISPLNPWTNYKLFNKSG